MESWSSEVNQQIDKALEKTRDKDIIFFRVKEFKRNIERIDSFSASCLTCKQEKININETVKSIDTAINVPGKQRRDYDRLISRMSKHMRKEHGFFTPYYFSYVYALYGTIGGLALGFLLSQLAKGHQIEMFTIGISVGLLISYFLGSLKDKKVRRDKKLM